MHLLDPFLQVYAALAKPTHLVLQFPTPPAVPFQASNSIPSHSAENTANKAIAEAIYQVRQRWLATSPLKEWFILQQPEYMLVEANKRRGFPTANWTKLVDVQTPLCLLCKSSFFCSVI